MSSHTNRIKVSVTVPIYNNARYLRKCLDSLAAQTLQEIEFILVNDGSTDNSGNICDEYARKNPKFKVIHQQNCGSADARQAGLDNAEGEFVIVCDSDDWVDPDMYETLYKAAIDTNSDIAMCGYVKEYPDNTTSIGFIPNIDKHKNCHAYIYLSSLGSTFTKLIRRSFIINSAIRYESGINFGEDALIEAKLFRHNPSITSIHATPYHYRRRYGEDSYTLNIKPAYVHQYHHVYQWIRANYPETRHQFLIIKSAVNTLVCCALSERPDNEFFARFMKENLKWKTLFRNAKNIQAQRVLLIKLFPTTIQIYLIRKYFSRKR